ncbi:MAG: threonine aldolase family protein [Phycisphaerales bacterium JB039]
MTPPIDLRSDTVTRPTPGMVRAMAEAPLGDDVLGDDPTVRRLEDRVADLLGKPAACFVPSGTMANACALRAHTRPGDEIIAHRESHIYLYETGGFAALCGCSIRLIDGPAGVFQAAAIEPEVRGADQHEPRTSVVAVENTHNRGGGAIWPIETLEAVGREAHRLGLRAHLDGARIWNAHVASGESLARIAAPFDTVSCCFSKGLGAPAGSILAGSADCVALVRRFRKMLGGAMRQSGVLAGAALYALDHHVQRLADDHANARRLAGILADAPGLQVDPACIQTNMVYFELAPDLPGAGHACAELAALGVLTLPEGSRRIRAVCHLDVSRGDIERAGRIISDWAGGFSRPADASRPFPR